MHRWILLLAVVHAVVLPLTAEESWNPAADSRAIVVEGMTLRPASARGELEKLQSEMPEVIDSISKMDVGCGFTATALNHLGRPTTCVPVALQSSDQNRGRP